jgi:hypothetical protein
MRALVLILALAIYVAAQAPVNEYIPAADWNSRFPNHPAYLVGVEKAASLYNQINNVAPRVWGIKEVLPFSII